MRRPDDDHAHQFPLGVEVGWLVVKHLEGLLKQLNQQFPDEQAESLQAAVEEALTTYGEHVGEYIEAHRASQTQLNHPIPDETPRRYFNPAEVFGLTDRQQLYYRVSDVWFQAILNHPDTVIHRLDLSQNDFGEYLFVTVSRTVNDEQSVLCFYGLGYHEQREQWITKHWYWYSVHPYSQLTQERVSLEEAHHQLQQRREDLKPLLTQSAPSERAVLFRMLAELTDENNALSELDDFDEMMGNRGEGGE
ncbi:MAG: hypothetical protein H6673_15555 [Anaerolineales bacterium]|nr:hypothetical protein [Anaerolineales bacterium]